MKFKGNLEIGKLWYVIQDDLDKKREKREKHQRIAKKEAEKYRIEYGGKYDSMRVDYPPNFIELKKNKRFEYIFLLLLKSEPLSFSQFLSINYIKIFLSAL